MALWLFSKLLNAQFSRPFNIDLLKNFNISTKNTDSLYHIIKNDDGSDVVFIINNSKNSHSLPTYKDFVIFNRNCDFKKLTVSSNNFGFVDIPTKTFIVFIPDKNNSPCP